MAIEAKSAVHKTDLKVIRIVKRLVIRGVICRFDCNANATTWNSFLGYELK
jgi:hypothetical protein